MTLRKLVLSIMFSFLGSGALASDDVTVDANASGTTLSVEVNGAGLFHEPVKRYWQCSAHSSHDDFQIFYGDRAYDKHEAQHSAIEACEYAENHECRPHRCARVR
jgi:hypothetical protein